MPGLEFEVESVLGRIHPLPLFPVLFPLADDKWAGTLCFTLREGKYEVQDKG